VNRFEGESVNLLKVGLFEDPSARELGYLFLGTDLLNPYVADVKASYFDGANERLFLPYTGLDEEARQQKNRIGVSHIQAPTLVSEGAVDLFELAQRVRPRPGKNEVLSFAMSSVQSLTPSATEWQSKPVFEYFTPTAVYRYTDEEDYVEILSLGNRCKLHFSRVDALNDRQDVAVTSAFLCPSPRPIAYGQNLLWSESFGLAFQADGTWTLLEAQEVAPLWQAAHERDVCLFSNELIEEGIWIDPKEPPDLSTLFCLSHEEYAQALQERQSESS
jgi:hypothetical protein